MHPVPVSFGMVEGAPVVISVAPGTEAARSDILPGDELIAVDGKPVEYVGQLQQVIGFRKPGEVVKLPTNGTLSSPLLVIVGLGGTDGIFGKGGGREVDA